MATEKIVLVLGESTTLSAKAGIQSDDNRLSKDSKGNWGSTGSCAVIDSDDLEGESVKIVGASIGKCVIFFRQNEQLTPEEAIVTSLGGGAADKLREIQDKYAVAFEVEVVAKKDAAKPVSPLGSSSQYDGLLPMNESQEEPSERTPYGMDAENKPVAPHPGMVGPDTSSIARQSEDAVVTGSPVAPPAKKEKVASKPAAAKSAASKTAAKKTGNKTAAKKTAAK